MSPPACNCCNRCRCSVAGAQPGRDFCTGLSTVLRLAFRLCEVLQDRNDERGLREHHTNEAPCLAMECLLQVEFRGELRNIGTGEHIGNAFGLLMRKTALLQLLDDGVLVVKQPRVGHISSVYHAARVLQGSPSFGSPVVAAAPRGLDQSRACAPLTGRRGGAGSATEWGWSELFTVGAFCTVAQARLG